MSLLNYFLYALFYVSSAQAYELGKNFDSTNFLNSFEFIETHDHYTGGFANYVSKQDATSMGLARTIGDQVYLGVDNSSIYDVKVDNGRKSVRLESYDTIDSGVIIADFEHVPANACGMWPSFWLLHDDGGPEDNWYSEIDVIESISEFSQNEITMYTNPAECIMTTPQAATGEVSKTHCNYESGGCSVLAPEGTFGDSFNKKGGGVWATQIEADGIKIWYFARSDIPDDIKSDAPDPKNWGLPVMNFKPDGVCDVTKAWRKMKIIINITFCGSYAGAPAWSGYTHCSSTTGVASCDEYVAQNPAAFDDVYFLVNSIKTYH